MSDDRRRITLSEDDFEQPPSVPQSRPRPPARPPSVPIREVARAGRRFLGMPLIPAAAAAIAVTVAVSIGVVVVVVKPGEKTAAGFCKALHDGEADIRGHLPNPHAQGSEALRQFVVALGGIGRYETMLDNMVDASPDEIKTDMTTARDTFKQGIDAAPGGATGGLQGAMGAFVSIAFKTLIHQPSFEHVDAYAQQHCGSTVFGSRPA
ncbi:MAG: hypothetical protein QOC77_1278 [Thermoleophilaceae bacterium]|jgi:hypothetical protein|nr:hypothetical protein [Thermoleophilaceae bacterium]